MFLRTLNNELINVDTIERIFISEKVLGNSENKKISYHLCAFTVMCQTEYYLLGNYIEREECMDYFEELSRRLL